MKKREAIVEGIFYPEERQKLSDAVKGYIHSPEQPSPTEEIYGLIVPHAGYNYCGEHTGRAFGKVSEKHVETVLLLGPVHRDPEEGVFLSESAQFVSPLGPVTVDQEINEELLSISTMFIRNDIPHLEEHCLEIQLPFIQTLFPKALIVPLLMGISSAAVIHALAGALEVILPGRIGSTLIIVTSNASTFVEKSRAETSARLYKDLVEKGDHGALVQGMRDRAINSCGAGITAAVLSLNSIPLHGRLVSEGSSLGGTGTDKHMVHYTSFILVSGKNNG